MSGTYVGIAVGCAVALALHDPSTERTRRLDRRRDAARRCAPAAVRQERRDLLLAAAAGGAVALLVGGASGLLGGSAAAVGARWALRRSRELVRSRDDAELLRSLPLAADLLAACVAAGASPAQSLAEVSRVATGPLAAALGSVTRGISLGLTEQEAWAPVISGGPAPLRTLAAALVRSSVSGAPPGPVIEAVAAEQRERQRLAGEAAARRAGVAMVAPLGLCFLPAFVLVGVVPLVAGLVRAGLSAVG